MSNVAYGLNIVIPNPRPSDYTQWGDLLSQMGPVPALTEIPVILHPGESIYSPSRAFRLTFQKTDGNIVLQVVNAAKVPSNWPTTPYSADTVPWTPIWAANTANMGGNQLAFGGDGNLVLWAPNGDGTSHVVQGPGIPFPTNTAGYDQAFFRIQDDGNLVIYAQGGRAVWASNTSAGEAPGANAT
jgi:hypothetical protein